MLDPGKTEIGKTEPNSQRGPVRQHPHHARASLGNSPQLPQRLLNRRHLPRREAGPAPGKRCGTRPQERYLRRGSRPQRPHTVRPHCRERPREGTSEETSGHGWLLGWEPRRGRANRGGGAAQLHTRASENRGSVHLQRLSFRGWARPS